MTSTNMKKTMQFRCPICKKTVQREHDDFPFCSSRCRTIDLGSWAAGDYHIAGDTTVPPDAVMDDSEGY